MGTLEMKITIPEVKGGRCVSTEMKDDYILAKFEIEENETSPISESELECKIDPSIFAGAWLKHQPTTIIQKRILTLYHSAKHNGRLHTFTCMTIDPSVKDGKLVYQKGLPVKTGLSQNQWAKILKDYNPSRNSRQMTRTEFVCRNLFLIQRLVESGYEIDEAWKTVCGDSREIGHYRNSHKAKYDFEPTGSREVCGFCDLGNTLKLIAEDPWYQTGSFWHAGGYYYCISYQAPVANMLRHDYMNNGESIFNLAVGMLALD